MEPKVFFLGSLDCLSSKCMILLACHLAFTGIWAWHRSHQFSTQILLDATLNWLQISWNCLGPWRSLGSWLWYSLRDAMAARHGNTPRRDQSRYFVWCKQRQLGPCPSWLGRSQARYLCKGSSHIFGHRPTQLGRYWQANHLPCGSCLWMKSEFSQCLPAGKSNLKRQECETYAMLRQDRQVAQNNSIWISNLEEVVLVGIRGHTAHNLGLRVFKLRVSSKILSFLLVGVRVRHFSKCSSMLNECGEFRIQNSYIIKDYKFK